MTEVLEEAYELVDKGIMTERDFEDFVFTNPTKLWTGMNPDFFAGTVVEDAVKKLALCRSRPNPAAPVREILCSSASIIEVGQGGWCRPGWGRRTRR